jgi:uncharacterized protein YndB with AHSA1/START domain
MTENNFSMQRFHHSIYLNLPLEEVYRLTATPLGITKWFIGEAVYESPEGEKRKFDEYVHAGDEFEWGWLEKDLSITGRVLEAAVNSHFKFSFGDSFVVTITVKEESGRTLFTLTQEYSENSEQNDFAHITAAYAGDFLSQT